MSAAAAFPNWVILETFVLRRDDEESFPDDSKAPIRASGKTSWGFPFRFAFSIAKPPLMSHLYAYLPAFPGPLEETPLAILAAHRHLALFRIGTVLSHTLTQDFFIYNASATDDTDSLIPLPPCTLPSLRHSTRIDGRVPRHARPSKGASARRRLQTVGCMGLLCRGEEQFAVAELPALFFSRGRSTVYADMYLLKSAGLEPGKWNSMRLPILHSGDPAYREQLASWQTNTVIPVNRWLCWIDYCLGILFCDVFEEPTPTVSFLRFPLDKFPHILDRGKVCSWLYRGVSAINAGRALKFIDVARNDGIGHGALMPGGGFTITCHTLMLDSIVWDKETLGSMVWDKDCTVTSDELWSAYPACLPRETLVLPQVNIDKPHVVHFLVSEFRYAMKKMWLVAVDMNTRTVESSSPYTNGREDIGTEREELTEARSMAAIPFFSPAIPFLTCEFSKYLHLSR